MENFLPPRPGRHGGILKDRNGDLHGQSGSYASAASPRGNPAPPGKSVNDPLNLFQSSRARRPSPPVEGPATGSTSSASGVGGRMFSAGNKEASSSATPSDAVGRFGRPLEGGSPRTATPHHSATPLSLQKRSFFQAAAQPSRPVVDAGGGGIHSTTTSSGISSASANFSGFGRFKSNFFGSSSTSSVPAGPPPEATSSLLSTVAAKKPPSSMGSGRSTRDVDSDAGGQRAAEDPPEEEGYDGENGSGEGAGRNFGEVPHRIMR